jgi:hypothetical protein
MSPALPDVEVEERFARFSSLHWSEFRRFLDRGVPSPALVYPELPARARVVFFADRPVFDFVEDLEDEGEQERAAAAFIFLARDELGDPCDLVAWEPVSARVAAWYGRPSLLGLENLWTPRIAYDGALVIFETPLEWLKAGRQGVVIVNPERAAPLLREAEHLCAPSEKYGRYLRSILTARPPRIVVPKASLGRAA